MPLLWCPSQAERPPVRTSNICHFPKKKFRSGVPQNNNHECTLPTRSTSPCPHAPAAATHTVLSPVGPRRSALSQSQIQELFSYGDRTTNCHTRNVKTSAVYTWALVRQQSSSSTRLAMLSEPCSGVRHAVYFAPRTHTLTHGWWSVPASLLLPPNDCLPACLA